MYKRVNTLNVIKLVLMMKLRICGHKLSVICSSRKKYLDSSSVKILFFIYTFIYLSMKIVQIGQVYINYLTFHAPCRFISVFSHSAKKQRHSRVHSIALHIFQSIISLSTRVVYSPNIIIHLRTCQT